MNLLGKIFTFVILVMSILFMGMAIMVYATHKNWRDIAQTTSNQLQQRTTEYDQLKSEYNRLENELTAEFESAQQQVRKLESERGSLVERNTTIQSELDQLRQERGEATASVASTQQNNSRLAEEVQNARDDIRTNQQLRDDAFGKMVTVSEDLQQVQGQLESTTERNRQLTQDVARMTTAMRENGLDPAIAADAVVPAVNGFVSRVEQTAGALLIEVSIGADDGLKPKHMVEVYRGSKYLGRAEILKTAPDRAVGRVERRYQQGQIQEGDRVATRLNHG
jgi:peptidoglycan hydrolase CwlO-like protein